MKVMVGREAYSLLPGSLALAAFTTSLAYLVLLSETADFGFLLAVFVAAGAVLPAAQGLALLAAFLREAFSARPPAPAQTVMSSPLPPLPPGEGKGVRDYEADWREALRAFLYQAKALGRMDVTTMRNARVVASARHWQALTDRLAEASALVPVGNSRNLRATPILLKANGQPTALAPGVTYEKAMLGLADGSIRLGPLPASPPPPVADPFRLETP